MNINLTPEQEKIVNEELRAGHFRTVEEVIGEALQALRKKNNRRSPKLLTVHSAKLFAKCWHSLRRTAYVWKGCRSRN